MTESQSTDRASYAVVGLSLAGVAASLELAAAGHAVSLLQPGGREGDLYGHWLVPPSPLNGDWMDADEWLSEAMSALKAAGVTYTTLWLRPPLSIIAGGTELLRSGGPGWGGTPATQLLTRCVVFAPFGEVPLRPEDPWPEDRIVTGISYDGRADAPYVKGRTVAVVGDGYHAIEMVLTLQKWAKQILLVWERPNVDSSLPLWETALRLPKLTPVCGARIVSLRYERDAVAGAVLEHYGTRSGVEVACVFIARDPKPTWSLIGGEARAQNLCTAGVLRPAGLAAGVDYADLSGQWRSGVTAARECLSDRRR